MQITELEYATTAEMEANCPPELQPLYWMRPNRSWALRPIVGLSSAAYLRDRMRVLLALPKEQSEQLYKARGSR